MITTHYLEYASKDKLYRVRKNIAHFIQYALPKCRGRVLEIGPASLQDFQFPEFFVDIESSLNTDLCEYLTLDRLPGSKLNADFTEPGLSNRIGKFDNILAFEVFEHTTNIWDVPNSIRELLSPSGTLFATTPFDLHWHGPRPDCWRLTPDAYKRLFEGFKLEVHTYCDNDNPNQLITVGIEASI